MKSGCHSCHRNRSDTDICANAFVMQGRVRDQSGGSVSSAAGGPSTPGRGAAPLMEQISWCEEDNHFPTISPNDWELDLSALEVCPFRASNIVQQSLQAHAARVMKALAHQSLWD